ncbi:hypothetical protein PM8797T_21168 [Gimesia maris DSM 8797]|nr:hypothetical protein PM8797T_21168 [Gimesia maris DSM 8797]
MILFFNSGKENQSSSALAICSGF